MAKAHIVTCRYCKDKFDTNKNEYVQPKARMYYHPNCWEEFNNGEDYKLYKYCSELFARNNQKLDYVSFKKLTELYIKKYDYTYEGMLKALRWFYEINNGDVNNSNGTVGILPYVYQRGNDYYDYLYQASLVNKEKDISEYIPKTNKISIDIPKIKNKNIKLFSLDWENENE